jgi:peptide/nickel transport system permease protein
LALSVLVVLLASVLTFILVAVSGDPLARERADPHAHARAIADREHQLHLDRPLPVRYALWARALLHGDLGQTVKDEDVGALVWRAAGVTARLVGAAVLLALVMTVIVGSVSAARHHSWFDHAGTLVAFILLSAPAFWLGGLMRDLTVRLNRATGTKFLFVVGERSIVPVGGFLASMADRIQHLVLPALTLSMLAAAVWTRYLRSTMLDSLGADYVRAARAKGLPEWRVVGHHAFRTSVVPLTTIVALSFAGLIGGSVVVEAVFTWPGLGQLLLRGIRDHDVNIVSACLLLTGAAVVAVNLAADVVCGVLDPRTRHG